MPMNTESERRRARRATLSLDEIIAAFALERDRHVTSGPATPAELRAVERAISRALPSSLSAFLRRCGAGLFFHGDEIFGPRRVMIHDIELVPDLLSIRGRLTKDGRLPDGYLPFHRARGLVHLIALDAAASGARIVSLPETEPHADLESFLEAIVLPRRLHDDAPVGG
jgi:hypothetical protein